MLGPPARIKERGLRRSDAITPLSSSCRKTCTCGCSSAPERMVLKQSLSASSLRKRAFEARIRACDVTCVCGRIGDGWSVSREATGVPPRCSDLTTGTNNLERATAFYDAA
jgi:hypothetical protein